MTSLQRFQAQLYTAFDLPPTTSGTLTAGLVVPRVAEVWRIGAHRLITLSPDVIDQADVADLQAACTDPQIDDAALAASVAERADGRVDDVVAYHAATCPSASNVEASTRRLDDGDGASVAALLAACSAAERGAAEVSLDDDLCWGAFLDGELAAVATMFGWHGFRDIGVIAHPDRRRRGSARAAVAALIGDLDERDDPRPALYRYELANRPSAQLAESLDLALGGTAYEIVR